MGCWKEGREAGLVTVTLHHTPTAYFHIGLPRAVYKMELNRQIWGSTGSTVYFNLL